MVVSIKWWWLARRLAKRGITMRCLDRTPEWPCGYEVKTMTRGRALMYARLHHWDTGHLVEVSW